jgi:hypothetical protein
MWNSLKQELKIQRGFLFFGAEIAFGAGVFGVLILVVLLKVLKGEGSEYVYAGTMIGLLCMVITAISFETMTVADGFSRAVCFQKPRKRYLTSIMMVLFLENVLSFSTIWIFRQGEEGLYHFLYPGIQASTEIQVGFSPVWIPVFAVLLTGISCLAGGLIRFHRKIGGLICLVIWMAGCIGVPGLFAEPGEKINGLERLIYLMKNWLFACTPGIRAAFCAGIGLLGMGLMYVLLCKKEAE